MKCNGCGASIDSAALKGTFSYGDPTIGNGGALRDTVRADHHKELCGPCARVIKDIILNSDLSEHHNS
jgi:hypothetical protein